MLRSTATRSILKSFTKAPTIRPGYTAASVRFRNANSFHQLSNNRPRILASLNRRPSAALLYATKSGPPFDHIDEQRERALAQKKLRPHPEEISGDSSVRHVFEKSQAGDEVTKSHGGLKSDLETIRETFSLKDVPKESLYIGAAGVLPYAATSLSTVYLAFDINHAHDHGSGYLFSPETAHQLLDLVTPIQIGYGAVIISFLGAIHWGMEYSGYGGYHSYRRYMYGVIAPAVAWPTIFMPVEYALITQFFAFNFLYFADARASARGWFPAWYGIYRFVLTFFVGASIVISLIGRGRIVEHDSNIKSPADYVKEDKDKQWEALEREEKARHQVSMKADEEDESESSHEATDESNESEEEEEDDDNKKDDKKGGKAKSDDKGDKDKKKEKK